MVLPGFTPTAVLCAALLLSPAGVLAAPEPAAGAPPGLDNLNFEAGAVGEPPPGWFVPKPVRRAGYGARTVAGDVAEGERSALITRAGKSRRKDLFGNLMRSVDATPYRGRRVRLSAQVKAFGRAQMWLRVDRARARMGFFDNMGDRPILLHEWQRYEIVGEVADDAKTLNFGLMVFGNGRAWFDDVVLEVLSTEGDP